VKFKDKPTNIKLLKNLSENQRIQESDSMNYKGLCTPLGRRWERQERKNFKGLH
jgi:hypothetical protein